MTTRPRSLTPLWWLLFSAGGVVSALLMPITIFLTGIAVAAGWLEEVELLDLVRNPLSRIYVFGLVSLSLFHWAHRFRYALIDLGFGRADRWGPPFYGTAVVGTLLAGVLVLRL